MIGTEQNILGNDVKDRNIEAMAKAIADRRDLSFVTAYGQWATGVWNQAYGEYRVYDTGIKAVFSPWKVIA